MSIQIRGCENSCAQCQKIYIPLHKEYPCPACGAVNKIIEAEDQYDEEHIHLDFINELIGSMKYYKANNGQFVPFGCYIRGMGGNIQNVVCWAFDKIEDEKLEYKTGMFDEDIKKYFGPEREYILPNINGILDEVYKRYGNENFFITKGFKKQKFSILEKIQGWFDGLIP